MRRFLKPLKKVIVGTVFLWAQQIHDGASQRRRHKGSSLLKIWRSGKVLLSIVAIVVVFTGCSESSRIDGQVVDGKDKPLARIRVTAVRAQPSAENDPRQTKTDSRGRFRIKGLLPDSPYSIVLSSDKWKTSTRKQVRSGSAGMNLTLGEKVVVRFVSSADGVIRDTALGLEWAPAPKETMSWVDAQIYASKPQFGRSGWRLPTRAELRSLHDESFEGHIDPAFHIDRNWVWALDSQSESDAWFYSFENGYEDTHPKEWLLTRGRVLIARTGDTERNNP